MTIPTIALQRAEPVGAMEDLDRMDRVDARAVLDLPAAGLAVAGGEVAVRLPELAEEAFADRHRDLILLFFQPVRAGDAATLCIQFDRPHPGNEREEVERGLADPVALLLAGRGGGNRQVQFPEVRTKLASLVQQQQELAYVVQRLA